MIKHLNLFKQKCSIEAQYWQSNTLDYSGYIFRLF